MQPAHFLCESLVRECIFQHQANCNPYFCLLFLGTLISTSTIFSGTWGQNWSRGEKSFGVFGACATPSIVHCVPPTSQCTCTNSVVFTRKTPNFLAFNSKTPPSLLELSFVAKCPSTDFSLYRPTRKVASPGIIASKSEMRRIAKSSKFWWPIGTWFVFVPPENPLSRFRLMLLA